VARSGSTLQGGNVTTSQTCAGSQRQSVAHSLPPLWFLVTSPTVSTDLQLFTLASNFPSSEELVQHRRWNFRKADWASYTLATERSILLIPVNNVSVEESYQRFCGAMLSLLPSLKSSGHYLRELGHPYELPTYQYSFSRATFVIHSLYNFR